MCLCGAEDCEKSHIYLGMMCAFVKLFYCSDCLVFVLGVEHTFVSTQNYAEIIVRICKSYFSSVDSVIHICDHFQSNFSPYYSLKAETDC